MTTGQRWEKYMDDELEQLAADMWRRDNPEVSVFLCDADTKARYRQLAYAALSSQECK
jgi:hypothetical protein